MTGRKRMSHHWLMNTSFSYNSTIVNFDGSWASAYERLRPPRTRPTSLPRRLPVRLRHHRQRHRQRLRQREMAVQVERPGQPALGLQLRRRSTTRVRAIRTSGPLPVRAEPTAPAPPAVLLDNVGDSRLPNYQNLDLHFDRPVKIGTVRFVPSAGHLQHLQLQHRPGAARHAERSNANYIQAVLAPRVLASAFASTGRARSGRLERRPSPAFRFHGRGRWLRPFFVILLTARRDPRQSRRGVYQRGDDGISEFRFQILGVPL